MPRSPLFAVIFAFLASACTTLGPMPGVTGASVAPEPRPGVEVQGGLLPGYFLSEVTQEEVSGVVISQLAGFVEPGELIELPGLSMGGRYVNGADGDGYFEPMLRYRAEVTDGFSLGAVGYGTAAKGAAKGASYSAIRGGVEASADFRVLPESRWVEIHLLGGGSLTGLSAKGRYCQNDDGFGRDCSTAADGALESPNVSTNNRGAYPVGFGGLALDFAKHSGGVFHGFRLAVLGAVGTMPHLRFGDPRPARSWTSWGLTLSMGAGARE